MNKIRDNAQPGYNIIESKYLKNYIVPEEKMGLMQFMRNIKRKKVNNRSEYIITGLDRIIYESKNAKETLRIIRKELVKAKRWIPRGLVLFFPVEGELGGKEDRPHLTFHNIEVDLKQLFGNRIERKSIIRCHASFDIEK